MKCATKVLVASRVADGRFKLDFLNPNCKSVFFDDDGQPNGTNEDLVVVVVPVAELECTSDIDEDQHESDGDDEIEVV